MIMRRMPTTASPWPPRLAALLLSAAAAGSAAYWVLHWRVASELPLAAGPVASAGAEVDTTAVARALGASGASTPATGATTTAGDVETARFVLSGVVADASAPGLALIAVDGKPAKPVAVGAVVVEGWTLHRVEARRAVLRRNGAELALQLPPLPQPGSVSKKTP